MPAISDQLEAIILQLSAVSYQLSAKSKATTDYGLQTTKSRKTGGSRQPLMYPPRFKVGYVIEAFWA